MFIPLMVLLVVMLIAGALGSALFSAIATFGRGLLRESPGRS